MVMSEAHAADLLPQRRQVGWRHVYLHGIVGACSSSALLNLARLGSKWAEPAKPPARNCGVVFDLMIVGPLQSPNEHTGTDVPAAHKSIHTQCD